MAIVVNVIVMNLVLLIVLVLSMFMFMLMLITISSSSTMAIINMISKVIIITDNLIKSHHHKPNFSKVNIDWVLMRFGLNLTTFNIYGAF